MKKREVNISESGDLGLVYNGAFVSNARCPVSGNVRRCRRDCVAFDIRPEIVINDEHAPGEKLETYKKGDRQVVYCEYGKFVIGLLVSE